MTAGLLIGSRLYPDDISQSRGQANPVVIVPPGRAPMLVQDHPKSLLFANVEFYAQKSRNAQAVRILLPSISVDEDTLSRNKKWIFEGGLPDRREHGKLYRCDSEFEFDVSWMLFEPMYGSDYCSPSPAGYVRIIVRAGPYRAEGLGGRVSPNSG